MTKAFLINAAYWALVTLGAAGFGWLCWNEGREWLRDWRHRK